MTRLHPLTGLAIAVVLTACGGNGDDDARGTLLEAPQTVATLGAAQIDAGTASSGLQPLTGLARCDVRMVALNYSTIGVNAEKANASGVMLVPAGACANNSHPLVAYAKATDVQKPRTLANPADGETFLLAAMYAAQGYAVVATDYLGYAKSTYSFHPYLHADSEATSVIDSIRAARVAAFNQGVGLSGKVMLAGYSQGGHSSMAAHRAIERGDAAEIDVAAAAHMAGPYNMSGTLKAPSPAGVQFFAPFFVTAWQKVYGNLYASVTQAFKEPFSNYIESLLPSPTLTFTTLVTTGALPGGPGVTPQVARDLIFQPAFVADQLTNENSPMGVAAKKNDLLGWNPRARTLLCGGAGDPTIPPALHRDIAQADFASRGLTHVTSVDVDTRIQAAFAPGGVAPTDPASAAFAAYFGSYHGTFEPPFCHAQARTLFDTLR